MVGGDVPGKELIIASRRQFHQRIYRHSRIFLCLDKPINRQFPGGASKTAWKTPPTSMTSILEVIFISFRWFTRALAGPALIRSRMIERLDSAKAPHIWNVAQENDKEKRPPRRLAEAGFCPAKSGGDEGDRTLDPDTASVVAISLYLLDFLDRHLRE